MRVELNCYGCKANVLILDAANTDLLDDCGRQVRKHGWRVLVGPNGPTGVACGECEAKAVAEGLTQRGRPPAALPPADAPVARKGRSVKALPAPPAPQKSAKNRKTPKKQA